VQVWVSDHIATPKPICSQSLIVVITAAALRNWKLSGLIWNRLPTPNQQNGLARLPTTKRKSRRKPRYCPWDSYQQPIVPARIGVLSYGSTLRACQKIGAFMHAGALRKNCSLLTLGWKEAVWRRLR